jgi:predicted nucleic acid-binding protein
LAVIVVDSDVLIDALRGREPAATRIAVGLDSAALATTTITAFELLGGARTRRTREHVERLLAGLSIFPFDADAAEAAAAARRTLEREGQPIGMADYLIAGICLARSTELLTRNRDHFERVPGLRLAELDPR